MTKDSKTITKVNNRLQNYDRRQKITKLWQMIKDKTYTDDKTTTDDN